MYLLYLQHNANTQLRTSCARIQAQMGREETSMKQERDKRGMWEDKGPTPSYRTGGRTGSFA